VSALIVAAINPANTPHGYNWTFAFPMLLFIVIALVLWALFGRPHHRVPSRPVRFAASAQPKPAAGVEPGEARPPGNGAGASG
jgi:hypothetical protein